MIRMTVALTRLPHLSREAFQAYWLERHGPLVLSLAEALGIVEYVQLHALDEPPADAPPGHARWMAPYDGLAEIGYVSRADFDARMETPATREAAALLRDDELCFIDRRNSPRWWGVARRIL